ncbi:YihY/virulence factor BrkB family protein [Nesterenkonia pannonica]|uniref:YhjD/YihY/BrkB family envelope integrity protein n=1 Tax=Nesterenkonia pannonica TaxID=1548602 RepID=UPI0021644272|nr:YhjD/YihY/BrkB family envelope integrity protein [Nesterenkonia pannonica]
MTGFFVDTVDDLSNGDEDVMGAVETVVGNISTAEGAGIGLAIGILAAMWTASNYVNAFSRSMNRIWEVTEGRPSTSFAPSSTRSRPS